MTRRESQVLVNYPPCDGYFELEEDVTLGCHQGALFATRPTKHPIHLASNLSYRRILDFLAQVGTQCDTDGYFSFEPDAAYCLQICEDALSTAATTSTRTLHDGKGQDRTIVRRRKAQYLNRHHEALASAFSSNRVRTSADKYLLDIVAGVL